MNINLDEEIEANRPGRQYDFVKSIIVILNIGQARECSVNVEENKWNTEQHPFVKEPARKVCRSHTERGTMPEDELSQVSEFGK